MPDALWLLWLLVHPITGRIYGLTLAEKQRMKDNIHYLKLQWDTHLHEENEAFISLFKVNDDALLPLKFVGPLSD